LPRLFRLAHKHLPVEDPKTTRACAARAAHALSLESDVVIAQRNRIHAKRRTLEPAQPTQPTKEEAIEVFGTVRQVFPSTTFSVELENGMTVLAHIAGRLRRHRIKILPGDRVDLQMSPYDLTKGRIVYRYRAGEARR
jgi:translation initiation factor IF-1